MKTHFSALGLTAVLALAATSAQAQASISFGPRVGVNLSSASISGPGTEGVSPKSIFGGQLGATADIRFGNFAIQPSLVFTRKGFKVTQSDTETFNGVTATYSDKRTLNINYLELPVNLVYTTGGDHGFQMFAGPYAAFGVGGNAPYETDVVIPGIMNDHKSGTGKINFANQEPKPSSSSSSNDNDVTVRRFDVGGNVGIGYRQGPFQVQASYGLSFSNLIPLNSDGSDSKDKAHNQLGQLTVNYFFGSN